MVFVLITFRSLIAIVSDYILEERGISQNVTRNGICINAVVYEDGSQWLLFSRKYWRDVPCRQILTRPKVGLYITYNTFLYVE